MTTAQSLYTEKDRWFDLLPKYLFLEPHLEGKRVLDVDCGAGWGSSLLARSAREVISLCASEDDLLAAREAEPERKRSFQRLIPGDLPFVDGTFDAVLALRGHWSFGDLEALAREAARLLKPSGFFCIASPNPGQKTLPELLTRNSPPPALGFYDLQRRLSAQFSQVRMVAQSPFFGFSLVDFSPEDPEAISLDPSLLEEGSEDASSFLALGAKLRLPRLDFSLIQLPLAELYPLLEGRAPSASDDIKRAYEAEIKRLKAQRAAILRDKNAWEARAQEATQRLKKLSRQKGDRPGLTSAQTAQSQEELQKAKARVAELEATLASAEEKQAKLEAERLRLERVALEHMGKVSEQKNELNQKEERNVELRAKLVRLTTKVRELERQITEGRFTEKNLQATLEKNEDAARDAEKRFRKLEEESRSYREQLSALTEEKENLARALADLKETHARCQEEISEERHQRRSLEARVRRAEHDASEQKEAAEQAGRHARALEARLEGAETRLAALQEELETTRAELATAQATLVDKDYLLAEAAAHRIDAEWRAEEARQEITLTRTLSSSNEFIENLASRAAELERAYEAERARAEAAERRLDLYDQENEIAQARILDLSQKLEELEATRLDLENALESSERRAAAAKERAFAAARDATSVRARLTQLEEELNTLFQEKETLSQELDAARQESARLQQKLALLEKTPRRPEEAPHPFHPEGAPQRLSLFRPTRLLSTRSTPQARARALSRLHAQTRRQASLLLRTALEKAALTRALSAQEEKLAAQREEPPKAQTPPAPEAKAPAPPPPPIASPLDGAPQGPEELARLYAQAASDLAAARAALEACRIARAEADRVRARAEEKLKEALLRVREAEEEKRNLQEKLRQQERTLESLRSENASQIKLD